MAKVSLKKKLLAGLLCLTMLSSSAIAGMMSVSAAETRGTESSSTVSALTNNSTINGKTDGKATIFLGDVVKLEAIADGGTAPYQYAFSVRYKPDTETKWSSYTSLKGYSTTATKDWTPDKTGTYQVCAKVRDAKGTEVKKFFTLTVNGTTPLTNNSTISATTITKGNSVTLKAVAAGGTAPYKYSFTAKHSTASKWVSLKGYNTTATHTWTPGKTGTYQVCAKVRDAKGTEVKNICNVSVVDSLENKSSISSYIVNTGDSVTINAQAEGGTGDYTYKYAVETVGGTKEEETDFVTESTFKHTFNAEGAYKLYVTVKDNKANITREKVFAVSVYKFYNVGVNSYRIESVTDKTVSYLGTNKAVTTITVPDYVQLTVSDGNGGEKVDSYKVVGIESLGAANIAKMTKIKLPATLEFVGDSVFENIGSGTSGGTEIYFDNSITSTKLSNLSDIGENAFKGAVIKQISLGANLVTIPDNAFDRAIIKELILEDGFNNAEVVNSNKNLFKGVTLNKVVLKGDNVKVTDGWFTDSNTGDKVNIELETGVTSYFYKQHKFEDNKFSIKCNTILSSADFNGKGITNVSFVSASKDNSNIDYTGAVINSDDIKSKGYIKVEYSEGGPAYLPTKLFNVTMTIKNTDIGDPVEFTVSSKDYGLGAGITCNGTITKVDANKDNIVVSVKGKNVRKVGDKYYIDLGYSVDANGNVSIESIDNALSGIGCTVSYRGNKDLTSYSTIDKIGNNAKLVYYEDTKNFDCVGTPTIKVTVKDNAYCPKVEKIIELGISTKLKYSTVGVTYVDVEGETNSNVEAYNGINVGKSDSYTSSLILPSTSSPFSTAIQDISVSVYTYCRANAEATTESIKLVTLKKGVDYALKCSTDLDTDGNGDISVTIIPKIEFLSTDFKLNFKSLTEV